MVLLLCPLPRLCVTKWRFMFSGGASTKQSWQHLAALLGGMSRGGRAGGNHKEAGQRLRRGGRSPRQARDLQDKPARLVAAKAR